MPKEKRESTKGGARQRLPRSAKHERTARTVGSNCPTGLVGDVSAMLQDGAAEDDLRDARGELSALRAETQRLAVQLRQEVSDRDMVIDSLRSRILDVEGQNKSLAAQLTQISELNHVLQNELVQARERTEQAQVAMQEVQTMLQARLPAIEKAQDVKLKFDALLLDKLELEEKVLRLEGVIQRQREDLGIFDTSRDKAQTPSTMAILLQAVQTYCRSDTVAHQSFQLLSQLLVDARTCLAFRKLTGIQVVQSSMAVHSTSQPVLTEACAVLLRLVMYDEALRKALCRSGLNQYLVDVLDKFPMAAAPRLNFNAARVLRFTVHFESELLPAVTSSLVDHARNYQVLHTLLAMLDWLTTQTPGRTWSRSHDRDGVLCFVGKLQLRPFAAWGRSVIGCGFSAEAKGLQLEKHQKTRLPPVEAGPHELHHDISTNGAQASATVRVIPMAQRVCAIMLGVVEHDVSGDHGCKELLQHPGTQEILFRLLVREEMVALQDLCLASVLLLRSGLDPVRSKRICQAATLVNWGFRQTAQSVLQRHSAHPDITREVLRVLTLLQVAEP